MKAKSPKEGDHFLHKVPCRKGYERQPSLQGWGGEGDECCIYCDLQPTPGEVVLKFEILEVWEETNEIYDLPRRAIGFFEGKKPESW